MDLLCTAALALFLITLATAYAYRVARSGRARHARIDRDGGSPLLGQRAMEMGYWAMLPVGRACVAFGVRADAVSWTALALAAAAAAALAAGRFGVGAALFALSSICDGIDGMVARESGTASRSGEILDAAVDRYAELFVFGALAVQERHSAPALVLVLAATTGAIMVSYASAKAEALSSGAARASTPRGIMRRQERAVYLVLGAALVPILAAAGMPAWFERAPLYVSLAMVALLGNGSAIRRLGALGHATDCTDRGGDTDTNLRFDADGQADAKLRAEAQNRADANLRAEAQSADAEGKAEAASLRRKARGSRVA